MTGSARTGRDDSTAQRFIPSQITSDVAFRAVRKMRTPTMRHKAALLTIALYAAADGTGACLPDDVLADKTEMSLAWTRRAVTGLIAGGYIRQPDPAAPVYDVILSETGRVPVVAPVPGQHKPNGPYGSWVGPHPSDPAWEHCPLPPRWAFIVYILFDAADCPCYIGSTDNLRRRLGEHVKVKEFATWQAVESTGFRAMLTLERHLIREHRPYLNIAWMGAA